MPVPDRFEIAADFGVCNFCNKSYSDISDNFKTVVFRIDEEDKIGRIYECCKNCFEKANSDKKYDDKITAKVFTEKLGRVVRLK